MKSSSLMRMSASKLINHASFVKNIGSKNSAQVSATTLAVLVTGAVPVGHTILVRSGGDFTSAAPTITDTKGNTYTSVRSAAGPGSVGRGNIHSCTVTTALTSSDTITLTWATAITNRAAEADEFAALLSPLTIDAQNGSTGTSTTPDANVTNTNLADLIFSAIVSVTPTSDTYTPDASWQTLGRAGTSAGTAPYISVQGAYQLAARTNTWHNKPVLQNSAVWIALAVAFKAT